MNAENDNQDKKLEGMLRRWGAHESRMNARGLDLAPPNLPADRRALRLVVRWGPLAAGIVLMIGAILVVVAGGTNYQQAEKGFVKPTASPERSPGDIDRKYAEALAALERARAALADSKTQFDALDRQYRVALAHAKELQSAADTRGGELAAEQRKAKEFADAAKAAADQLAEFKQQSEAAGKLLKEQVAGLVKEKGAAEAKLSSAVQELGRMRQMNDEAIAAAKKSAGELAVLKAQQEVVFNDIQRAFLAGNAGGAKGNPDEADTGIQARQAAARQHRLAARCSEVRSSARGDDVRKLLDKLEAVLTRLDMIDVNNAGALKSFAGLLAGGEIIRQIDQVLGAGDEGATVRAVLLEARFVLAGAQRAG